MSVTIVDANSEDMRDANLKLLTKLLMERDVLLKALRYADKVLFDTYSNAQKLTWQQVEENCRKACKETSQAIDTIDMAEG